MTRRAAQLRVGDKRYRLAFGFGDATHLARPGTMTAICGYGAPGDDPDASEPTCGRCIRIAWKSLPKPVTDDRFDLAVARSVEAIVEFGSIMIFEVPAERAEGLRVAIRTALRARRLRCTTMYEEEVVVAWSDDV